MIRRVVVLSLLLVRVLLPAQTAYLQDFVCNESIERYKNNKHVDHVFAQLSYSNDIDHYSNVLQNKKKRSSIAEIGGAWSQGEYGTFLKSIERLSKVVDKKLEKTAIENIDVYSMSIPQQYSDWTLNLGKEKYVTPFTISVWINKEGQIVKISRRTTIELPEKLGISWIEWTVELANVKIDNSSWMLPVTASYTVQHHSYVEYNAMKFSDYHKFSVESVIAFQ